MPVALAVCIQSSRHFTSWEVFEKGCVLQDTGPLFRHFKPQFPFTTDSSLTKASKLNCTFVFQKVAAPPTQLPRPIASQPGDQPLNTLPLCMLFTTSCQLAVLSANMH